MITVVLENMIVLFCFVPMRNNILNVRTLDYVLVIPNGNLCYVRALR